MTTRLWIAVGIVAFAAMLLVRNPSASGTGLDSLLSIGYCLGFFVTRAIDQRMARQ